MLALSENPPMVLEGTGAFSAVPGEWWIAHTKSRNEKALAWDFHNARIPYFLPLVEHITISSGQKRRALKPLFPSYVFFCGTAGERYSALTTSRVCQVIPVRLREKFVGEIESVRKGIEVGSVTLYPFAAVGKRCRIARGPLQGIEGIVVRNQDSVRIVLEVSMLGQGASLEIEADLLEPVE
jgi:transcription termination/antitermination protein NusG